MFRCHLQLDPPKIFLHFVNFLQSYLFLQVSMLPFSSATITSAGDPAFEQAKTPVGLDIAIVLVCIWDQQRRCTGEQQKNNGLLEAYPGCCLEDFLNRFQHSVQVTLHSICQMSKFQTRSGSSSSTNQHHRVKS